MTPWPHPVPGWYYAWEKWQAGGRKGQRPAGVPRFIPHDHWAWKLYHYRRPHKPPAPPLPPPPPAPPAWKPKNPATGRNGLYFYTAANAQLGLDGLIDAARRYKLWVAFLVHNVLDPATDENNPPGWRERLQASGVVTIASGWLDARQDLEAQAKAVAKYSMGFDEYLANVEGGTGWGYPSPEFSNSEVFCPLLRRHTSIPVSCSIEWGEGLHFKPWLDIGVEVFRPQCYGNEHPHMTGPSALDRAGYAQHDLPEGLKPHNVEPTYGTYGSFQRNINEYKPEQAACQSRGVQACSFWAAEFVSPGELTFFN